MSEDQQHIWFGNPTLHELSESRKNTMVEYVGIEFTELGEDYLIARMPVDHRTIQPYGLMHGGASCVLAETVGSLASNYCLDQNKYMSVGVEINTSHIKSVRKGFVIGIATPLHLGRSTHVWEIPIYDEEDNLVSMTRLRLAVLNKK